MTGDFFAVGKDQWAQACKLGLNPAVAFLVLARGTGRDNITTRWSAESVSKHTGISWRRAKDAIAALEQAKLASISGRGEGHGPGQPSQGDELSNPKRCVTRPIRKLAFPSDLENVLWLPNTLVDGVAGKSSPVARLRQTQKVDYLQAFIELYGRQDLAGDGGLPRSLIWMTFTREHVCDAGQFKVYGFKVSETICCAIGPLARFRVKEKPKDAEFPSWQFLYALRNMGLLEIVHYLAEGESPDSELLHPLTGDPDALAVRDAAVLSCISLPEWVLHQIGRAAHDYLIPVIRDIPAPAVCGVFRLTYRPHTKLTGAWWARHREACERFTTIYNAIAQGDFKRAIAA